ncbi:hypothetical protein D6V40_05360 [Vibrio cholerae]|nr:hypothetical protein [Vibrio cholerae]MVB24071.1 hypothetical protein [Vibrio cholerae]HDV5377936.1 hypothetical protein [Vibrio cholerae]HDZ9269006.1 hypothetical protein [Vibrio cholerae]
MASHDFVERVKEALHALDDIRPEDVLSGRQKMMSLRLFSQTFDISRTSLGKHRDIGLLVSDAIERWNDEYMLVSASLKETKSKQKKDDLYKQIDAQLSEIKRLRGIQLSDLNEKNQLRTDLEEALSKLEQLKNVGRFPSIVEGFTAHYANSTPLWFQFEVLRLYGAEHEPVMRNVEELKNRYSPVLPGGVEAFYSLLVRPEPSFYGRTMIESLKASSEDIERLLKMRSA